MSLKAAARALAVASIVIAAAATASAQGSYPCPTAPAVGCSNTGEVAKLRLKVPPKANQTQTFLWKFRRCSVSFGELGDPTAETDYATCMYEDGVLVWEALTPHDLTCGRKAKPCWKLMKKRGFVFRDPKGFPHGVTFLKLSSNGPTKGRMKMQGRGDNLALPLPLSPLSNITMQMHNSQGMCWETVFDLPNGRSDAKFYIDDVKRNKKKK